MSKKHVNNNHEDSVTIEELIDKIKQYDSVDISKLVTQLISISTKEELAARWWPIKIREELNLAIPVTIYIQDPQLAKDNSELIQKIILLWESGLLDGPTSSRVAVVDYDGDKNELYKPARWDIFKWCFVGLDSQEWKVDIKDSELKALKKDEYQFHQVNVWAVISSVLEYFQEKKAMGRLIPWGFEGNRIIVLPHAGYGENAFYDRQSKSIQFYYYDGENAREYTCLSHDIIAHETGHAILDGIRPHYNEISSYQTAAFHEFIADLTAILTSMRNNDMRHLIARLTKGNLAKDNFIAKIAEGFGEHVKNRKFLRTALNNFNMKEDVKINNSPHDNSRIFTGAMFDIMIRMAKNYMEIRKKKSTDALWHTIDRFTRVALQPLDYCPPVDIQFKDFADAILVRDRLTDPQDPYKYRTIMRKVFDKRQIPYSEEEKETDYSGLSCPNVDQVLASKMEAYAFIHSKRKKLFIPEEQDIMVLNSYQTEKAGRLNKKLPREVVVQYIWQEDVELKGSRFEQLEGKKAALLCGGTLVFDDKGNLLYWCRKPGTQFKIRTKHKGDKEKEVTESQAGEDRQKQLLDYIASLISQGVLGFTASEDEGRVNLYSQVESREAGGRLKFEMSPRLHFHKT